MIYISGGFKGGGHENGTPVQEEKFLTPNKALMTRLHGFTDRSVPARFGSAHGTDFARNLYPPAQG